MLRIPHRLCQRVARAFPMREVDTPEVAFSRSFQHLGFLLGNTMTTLAGHSTIKFLQAIFQFFHGLQNHPRMSSGIPRRISLKRISSHLFPSSLILSREPFFAIVHLPRLSFRRTLFCVCLLRSEVLLRCRARRDFHSLHHPSASFRGAELPL